MQAEALFPSGIMIMRCAGVAPELIAARVRSALAWPSIKGIVLDIDAPPSVIDRVAFECASNSGDLKRAIAQAVFALADKTPAESEHLAVGFPKQTSPQLLGYPRVLARLSAIGRAAHSAIFRLLRSVFLHPHPSSLPSLLVVRRPADAESGEGRKALPGKAGDA